MIEVKIDEITQVRTWEITIPKEEMFSRVSVSSVYINNNLPEEQRGERRELLEPDRVMFNKHYRESISDLIILLTRYFQNEITPSNMNADGDFSIVIHPTLHMRDSIAYAMDGYILEVIEKNCLVKWFGREADAIGARAEYEDAVDKLTSSIHYRRKGVRLPINPLL
ncbi:MAG: hypothetical protein EOM36_06615 [Bacteroidia bacterium]|nr:hypothetical protein [Bacteroidia bacterium]